VNAPARQLVTLGRISGAFGVKGWVKVHSFTDPRDSIAEFDRWILRADDGEENVVVETGKPHGRTVIAKLEGVDDRDRALELIGAEIAVERDALAPCEPGQYYWTDLVGMQVVTRGGISLGTVDHLVETGANDVLVVRGERERLVPFIREQVIVAVDPDARVITVDWDPDD